MQLAVQVQVEHQLELLFLSHSLLALSFFFVDLLLALLKDQLCPADELFKLMRVIFQRYFDHFRKLIIVLFLDSCHELCLELFQLFELFAWCLSRFDKDGRTEFCAQLPELFLLFPLLVRFDLGIVDRFVGSVDEVVRFIIVHLPALLSHVGQFVLHFVP